MTIARIYDFTDGQKVYSAEVDAELNQLVASVNAITGAAATDEAALTTHKSSTDHDAHVSTLHYTKTNMQTSGGAQLHWANLTNVPNLADSSWKPAVAAPANLPVTGNTLGDQRIVLNDGDGKQALYSCIATTGTVDEQWDKIGDVDWQQGETDRVTAENLRVIAEGLRVTAENGRDSAEDTRVIAESARATAEGDAGSGRVKAEAARVTAEGLRVTAEGLRVTAENAREAAIDARLVIGAYAAGTAYVVGNEVTYNGSTYRCILASTGNLPTNATYWIQTAAKGTDGTMTPVEDVLTSTSTTNALSANQGKVLDAKITAIKRTDVSLMTAPFTCQLVSEGKLLNCYSANPIIATIATNANIAFPTFAEIHFVQTGAGVLTITPASGVTLNGGTEGISLTGKYKSATIKKMATNTWIILGGV